MGWVAGHGETEERQTRVLSGFPSVTLRVLGYRSCLAQSGAATCKLPRDGHVPQKSAATCAPNLSVLPACPLAPARTWSAPAGLGWFLIASLPKLCAVIWTNWPDGAGSPSALQTLILCRTGLGNWWETWLILEY